MERMDPRLRGDDEQKGSGKNSQPLSQDMIPVDLTEGVMLGDGKNAGRQFTPSLTKLLAKLACQAEGAPYLARPILRRALYSYQMRGASPYSTTTHYIKIDKRLFATLVLDAACEGAKGLDASEREKLRDLSADTP